MQGQAPEVMDVIQLDGMRGGLRTLVGAGLTAEDAGYKLYDEIIDAQGRGSEYLQSAAICWLVSEAEALADGVREQGQK